MNYSSVKKEYEEVIKKKQEMIINEDRDKGRTLRDLLDKQMN